MLSTNTKSFARPVRVFMPCTGLGRQHRGFEVFTTECSRALRHSPDIECTVFKGAGRSEKLERVVVSASRDGRLAKSIGRLFGRSPYFVEQATFFAGFLPHLVAHAPDVIYFADLNLGNLCWHWRRISGQQFGLVFYNGGATTKPFTRCDHVQQVAPSHVQDALARGESLSRQTLLPHALQLGPEPPLLTSGERHALRAALGLPVDRPLVLSVGLLARREKRMDYVIRDIARLPEPRPFVVLLGQRCEESFAIESLAAELLGSGNYAVRTVRATAVGEYYAVADVFTMASLCEGFGLVYLEAMSHGLPCIAHDDPVPRFVLGTYGIYADLRAAGALATQIAAVLPHADDHDARKARARSSYERFSWDVLRRGYVEMLVGCASANGSRASRRRDFGRERQS